MTADASFADGAEAPLRLVARDAEDLQVISGLVQDGVLSVGDITYRPAQRRLVLLVNRLRHEDTARAAARGRPVERVRATVVVEDVQAVRAQGIDPAQKHVVLALLTLAFAPGPDGTGRLLLTCAGDGAIEVEVEALEVLLRDVTRPYAAPSGRVPDHQI